MAVLPNPHVRTVPSSRSAIIVPVENPAAVVTMRFQGVSVAVTVFVVSELVDCVVSLVDVGEEIVLDVAVQYVDEKVSLNELEVSLVELEVSVSDVQDVEDRVSLIELDVSLTELAVSDAVVAELDDSVALMEAEDVLTSAPSAVALVSGNVVQIRVERFIESISVASDGAGVARTAECRLSVLSVVEAKSSFVVAPRRPVVANSAIVALIGMFWTTFELPVAPASVSFPAMIPSAVPTFNAGPGYSSTMWPVAFANTVLPSILSARPLLMTTILSGSVVGRVTSGGLVKVPL